MISMAVPCAVVGAEVSISSSSPGMVSSFERLVRSGLVLIVGLSAGFELSDVMPLYTTGVGAEYAVSACVDCSEVAGWERVEKQVVMGICGVCFLLAGWGIKSPGLKPVSLAGFYSGA